MNDLLSLFIYNYMCHCFLIHLIMTTTISPYNYSILYLILIMYKLQFVILVITVYSHYFYSIWTFFSSSCYYTYWVNYHLNLNLLLFQCFQIYQKIVFKDERFYDSIMIYQFHGKSVLIYYNFLANSNQTNFPMWVDHVNYSFQSSAYLFLF